MVVQSVVDEFRLDLTYNFEVADFHTYYVTERRVLVHNCGGEADVTKSVETKHTVNTGGKHPKKSDPNSIIESQRADGSRSVTYYDEQGRAFSREDYGQLRTHGQLGRGADGKSVPHEHRVDFSDRGPIGKRYRELDNNGKPVGPWIDE